MRTPFLSCRPRRAVPRARAGVPVARPARVAAATAAGLIGSLVLTAVAAVAAAPAAQGPVAATQGPAAAAEVPAGAEHARAFERCEDAVNQTLQRLRGRLVGKAQFDPARRTLAADEEGGLGVKGAGRYRPAGGAGGAGGSGRAFDYTCSFSPRTASVSGVVLREATPGATADAPWQPDLSHVMPEVCESAVARLLKARHPRVVRIGLDPETRRLEPAADERLLLTGRGALRRAEGMNAEAFSYACELDPRDGRVLQVRTGA